MNKEIKLDRDLEIVLRQDGVEVRYVRHAKGYRKVQVEDSFAELLEEIFKNEEN